MANFNVMNLFKPRTREELNQRVIATAETLRELDELGSLGKDMLKDARYAKLKEKFDRLFGQLLRDLLNYKQENNDIYATNVRVILTKIQDLLALIDTPVSFLNHVTLQRFELEKEASKPGEE